MNIINDNTKDTPIVQSPPETIVLPSVNNELASIPEKEQKTEQLPPKIIMVG